MFIVVTWLIATAAPTPAEHLARGEQLLAALEYENAAYELSLAATAPGVTDEQKLRANLLAGIAHRIIGKDTDARINFRYVLLRAPSTTLPPDTTPKVLLFFESVRGEVQAERDLPSTTPPPGPSLPAPAPPPVTPTPAPDPAPAPPSPLFMTGAVVAGIGALGVAGGAAGVFVAETALADPARLADDRGGLQALGQLSTLVVVVSTLAAATGGALIVLAPP